MAEKTLSRVVKSFGNGAHITVPSEWIGYEVEVEPQIPERPMVFKHLSIGCDITVSLENGGEITGIVTDLEQMQNDYGLTEFFVVCEIDHSVDNYSETLSASSEVAFREVCEFELIVSKLPHEPWGDSVAVEYYGGEFEEKLDASDTAEAIDFTISHLV